MFWDSISTFPAQGPPGQLGTPGIRGEQGIPGPRVNPSAASQPLTQLCSERTPHWPNKMQQICLPVSFSRTLTLFHSLITHFSSTILLSTYAKDFLIKSYRREKVKSNHKGFRTSVFGPLLFVIWIKEHPWVTGCAATMMFQSLRREHDHLTCSLGGPQAFSSPPCCPHQQFS